MKPNVIKARKLLNARDLGKMRTVDGKTIAENRLIRSARPEKLPDSSVKKLLEKGLTTVVDLRTAADVADHPDTEIAGTVRISIPTLTTATEDIFDEPTMRKTMERECKRVGTEFSSARDYMIATYRAIVFNESSQKSLARFLRTVIENKGCLLFHCASGKDRTGICAMLVESLLGVSEKDIYEDYIASRRFLRRRNFWRRLGLFIYPTSRAFKRFLYRFIDVEKIYLETVIEEMKQKYGCVVDYCKRKLGVTDEDVDKLKANYLV